MPNGPGRWGTFALLLGLYLTFRGYHSFDGDQAFRLPLLLHAQDRAAFSDDPFVRAFDAFNPHRGYLTLLDGLSRAAGLPVGMLVLYLATYTATCFGVDRLARQVWPDLAPGVGPVAMSLFLLARAGNIGTNHLFDGILLDRLIAMSLGWLALAVSIERSDRHWLASVCIGLAALVHPSLGLQLGALLGGSWVIWAVLERREDRCIAAWEVARGLGFNLIGLSLALLPAVMLMSGQSRNLLAGLPREEIWRLSVELQSPQHMLPHLWRKPQWLAWGAYFAMAGLAAWDRKSPNARWSKARRRLVATLGLVLVGLAGATVVIEVFRELRLTMFQPFRMATVARGLALILVAGRVQRLWSMPGGRVRAVLLAVGLTGDWMFVVAAGVEILATLVERVAPPSRWAALPALTGFAVGLVFLYNHDTEQGQWALIGAAVVGLAGEGLRRRGGLRWNRRRVIASYAAAWTLPIAALIFPPILGIESGNSFVTTLAGRCRVWPVPLDDVERLAVWTRDNTPGDARFIGPPGPKGFRLWSLRSVAFNRAGSPYHAQGLADWAARFRDHVGLGGGNAELVSAYLADRQGLERRFNEKTDSELAALAGRQGATHVLASTRYGDDPAGPLELLRSDGDFAVYRVRREGTSAPTAMMGTDVGSSR